MAITETKYFRNVARTIADILTVEEAQEIIDTPGIEGDLVMRILADAAERERNGEVVPMGRIDDHATMVWQACRLRARGEDPDQWNVFHFPESWGIKGPCFSKDLKGDES